MPRGSQRPCAALAPLLLAPRLKDGLRRLAFSPAANARRAPPDCPALAFGDDNGAFTTALRRPRSLRFMTDLLATLFAAHASGKAVTATIEETYERIARHNDPALFIALRPKAEALAIASRLEAAGREGKSLFGVPFVVKDKSTSPACRQRPPVRPSPISRNVRRSSSRGSSAPERSSSERPTSISSRPASSACARPTASPRNALRPDLIPGGSSSGSATAVGAGLVPFSLGTDTAGSGRSRRRSTGSWD